MNEIEQLYCKRVVGSGRNRSITYELKTVSKDGRERKLLSSLETSDIAVYIEQQIETWLKIPDQAVWSELPK